MASNSISAIWALYFILFMILGFFFFLNLFIGVVVSTFNAEQDKIGGNDLLTEKQREWIDLKLLVLRSAPITRIKPPESKFRLFFFNISQRQAFERFIFMSIVLNTIVLTMKWYEQSKDIETILEIINYVFTAIFMSEAIIKIMGIGTRLYFQDSWNRFDFSIAVLSLVSIIISEFGDISLKGALTLVRSVRLLRILRLLRRGGRSLFMIFNTFVITLQSLANIGSLLLLVIFMYSVIGMTQFGNVMRTGMMNDYMNFETFLNSFMTLFVISTGDSWNNMMAQFTLWP